MGQVIALPGHLPGEVFFDAARPDHSMKLTWHADDAMVVLSLWTGSRCTGTLHLPVEDVPRMVSALVTGLVPAP